MTASDAKYISMLRISTHVTHYQNTPVLTALPTVAVHFKKKHICLAFDTAEKERCYKM